MNKNIYIVSGIDTDCGKTYITGRILIELQKQGKNVISHKLIQTGCQGISEDILEHRSITNSPVLEEDKLGLTCPYVLSFPASPHLAAAIDKVIIDPELIMRSLNELADKYELVITEGAGGLMVPLSKNKQTIEFIHENKIPLILVSSSKLGSINHTLLSLSACKEYGIDLRYLIYNQFEEHDQQIATSSFDFIKTYISENFPETKVLKGTDLDKIEL